MGGKKKTKAKDYAPEALEFFGKSLELVRQPNNAKDCTSKFQVNLKGLQVAIQTLPKENRESVEKFWGLTGGPNHSKKMANSNINDVAFFELRNKAIHSLRMLLTVDYMLIYNEDLNGLINIVSKKVNKSGLTISDVETTKLIMAFSIYFENGPKLVFEEDPMSIDRDLNGRLLFDEYEVLCQICQEIQTLPDYSINMRLFMSFLEMIDFQEMLAIKKSIGIEISKFFERLQVIEKGQGIQKINDFGPEDIETVRSVTRIREWKERIFRYGEWEVTAELILGNNNIKFEQDVFNDALDKMKGHSLVKKIEGFKTSQTVQIRTSSGVRTLNVYKIGEFKFTDPQEIEFLYLYGNLA